MMKKPIQQDQQEIVNKCLSEVTAVLEKHGCTLGVIYQQHVIMGKRAIIADPVVIKK